MLDFYVIGITPGSSSGSNFGDYNCCESPEVDVVAFTPMPQQSQSQEEEKKYFCQRCLNHGEQHPRKGHKPFCQFSNCECTDCRMVEERRKLNNLLSSRRLDPNHSASRPFNGKKIRDPKCARCSAHGNKQPLRGHKKAQCPYIDCPCHLCKLVENRRVLMARQIKLRRDQQKQRKAQTEQKKKKNDLKKSLDNDDDFAKPVANEEPIRVPPLMPTVMPATIQMPQITSPILPTMPSITTPIQIPATVPAQPTQILQSTTILPTQTLYLPQIEPTTLINFNYGLLNPLTFSLNQLFQYGPGTFGFFPTQ